MAVALALAGTGEVRAMGRMYMFSAVQGVVTGKPVAGAVVERRFKWAWKDETGVEDDGVVHPLAAGFAVQQLGTLGRRGVLPSWSSAESAGRTA